MDPNNRLTVILVGVALSVTFGAWALANLQRWRRKSPEEIERLRRLDVNRRGRITAGRIVDFIENSSPPSNGRLLVYKYEVAGVTYEAAQDISALLDRFPLSKGLAGHTASVKYDPKKPTNSIIACEEWCGV